MHEVEHLAHQLVPRRELGELLELLDRDRFTVDHPGLELRRLELLRKLAQRFREADDVALGVGDGGLADERLAELVERQLPDGAERDPVLHDQEVGLVLAQLATQIGGAFHIQATEVDEEGVRNLGERLSQPLGLLFFLFSRQRHRFTSSVSDRPYRGRCQDPSWR